MKTIKDYITQYNIKENINKRASYFWGSFFWIILKKFYIIYIKFPIYVNKTNKQENGKNLLYKGL